MKRPREKRSERERGWEGKREKFPKRVFMEQKNIDRSHTRAYICARTRRRF